MGLNDPGRKWISKKRIDATIESINERIDSLVNRPGMMTGTDSYHLAEVMLTHFLCIRATLVGGDYDYRKYCNEHYSDIPGPARCISTYLTDKWEGYDPGFGPDDGQKNDEWAEEASKLVDWAMEKMSEMDEEIIAEEKSCEACKHCFMEPSDMNFTCGHPESGRLGMYIHRGPVEHCGPERSKFEQHAPHSRGPK